MKLKKEDSGYYSIKVEFSSREGKSNHAVFQWNGSKLKVISITDLDYLENLYEEVSQKLNAIKGIL